MAWSANEVALLARRMEGKPKGFRVSAKTAPLIVAALRFYSQEGFAENLHGYRVDAWDTEMNSIIEHVGAARNLFVARKLFDFAVANAPGQRLTLRHGARLLEDSGKRPPSPAHSTLAGPSNRET